MKKEKTLHELSKAFPEKTYRELEMYRAEDRQQEAGICIMGEMRKDREGEEQDNPTLWDIAKELKVTYADAVPIQEDRRLKKEAKIEAAKIKKDVTDIDRLKKRAEEAEGELSIMKGIETNRVKEAQARCDQLQNELDRVKQDNNDLFNRVAEALEVNESHQKINGKLQEKLTALQQENRTMDARLGKVKSVRNELYQRIDRMRKAGM
tara:strand:+ start:28 stop:651 length:624 start_codon:yes stop_codon:yes gene_type:complete